MPINEVNLVLVQPGSTELDEQGRLIGSLDIPLSVQGESQVRELVEKFEDQEIGLIVCAPSLAAQQTAQQLSRNGSIKVRVDENLANIDIGLWHGKAIEELKETQPRIYKQWREQPQTVTPPEGESVELAADRVRKTLRWISKKNRNMTVMIVAAHPLAAIVQAEALGLDLAKFWNANIGCGNWTKLASAIEVG